MKPEINIKVTVARILVKWCQNFNVERLTSTVSKDKQINETRRIKNETRANYEI